MEKIYIGKIVSTHGIKGEIKLLSNFEYKDKVFFPGSKILIDDVVYKINSYRKHKQFDMITLDGYNDINEVLSLMKKKVYIEKEALKFSDNEILDDDLISYKVLTTDKRRGIIKEIFYASEKNKIIRTCIEKQEVLIPYNTNFVKEIKKEEKQIVVELIGGMLDEN